MRHYIRGIKNDETHGGMSPGAEVGENCRKSTEVERTRRTIGGKEPNAVLHLTCRSRDHLTRVAIAQEAVPVTRPGLKSLLHVYWRCLGWLYCLFATFAMSAPALDELTWLAAKTPEGKVYYFHANSRVRHLTS